MKNKKVEGVLAEFGSPAELLKAAEQLRDSGYRKFDCHSPFPVHGMDGAMGEKRSPLGWMVGIIAIGAFLAGFAFEGWTSAIDYPITVSGKPFFSYQAFGTIAFAVMVFSSALTALVGMLLLNKLPQFFHPIFHSDRFSKVTDDAFFVSIEADNDDFDPEQARSFLEKIGGKNIEFLVDRSDIVNEEIKTK